jgi:UDP-N-acetylmuramoyl-L-alanyl-D-glutamate--2,6-diaminopimelate ligase
MDVVLDDVVLEGTDGELDRVEVTDIAFDHRQVRPGALFCCIPGQRTDGHQFAAAAADAGAVGLLVERPVGVPVPQARVRAGQARRAMALAACRLWGHPSRQLVTVGVTGTNGKTSVTHLLGTIFGRTGRPTVVVGTLDGGRTTPEAPDLQRRLATAVADGCTAAAVEVSSHALDQDRVAGTWFAAGVFTNLGHDHLDHHRTMEAYFEAKARLFHADRCGLAVVNRDDPWGRRLLDRLEATGPAVETFGAGDARILSADASGTVFSWRGHEVRLPLAGRFQVANALAAATTASCLGVADTDIAAALAAAAPVPGRFEVVVAPPTVPWTGVVDFAHTPDALRSLLASARSLAGGHRLICVVGCGGDRDRAKRPLMGTEAARNADVVVVTSDNPRSEPPEAIIDEVVRGVDNAQASGAAAALVVEVDRRRAIERAAELAEPGDVVVVAGKGHETTIEMAGVRLPFDDRAVLCAAATGGDPS